jgi:hypothetical protein
MAGRRTPTPRTRADGWLGITVAIVLALGLATLGGALLLRHGPSRASVGGAVDRFRAKGSTSGATVALQPTPGVYVYAGTGDEHLSFLSTSQSQEGDLPGTVTAGAYGCWTFAIEYNSFHHQSWRRCATDGRLVEPGGTTDQHFDFGVFSQSEHTDVVCDPPTVLFDPAFADGHVGPVRCVGRSETTNADMVQRGQVTFVGRTTVRVGTTPVPALHYRQDVRITGGQHGSSHESVWLAADTGLPVREERAIEVVSPAPSPINTVTYRERGAWRLTSLTPRT